MGEGSGLDVVFAVILGPLVPPANSNRTKPFPRLLARTRRVRIGSKQVGERDDRDDRVDPAPQGVWH